jgi:uroporphyrin-III C-methyltransferase
MSAAKAGRVAFIGAGPGAADLITLRGARLLAQADVVLFDALTDPALRELAPQARWLDVGKRGFCTSTGQATIDALLVRMALEHALVVRLKGGDPSVFGRLEEELLALTRARPRRGCGKGRSVSLTTAMTADGELGAGRHADTEVFYMAGRQLGKLGRALRGAGWPDDTPVCVVSRAGWPDCVASDHTVLDLASAALLHAGRPAVVTVGAGATAVQPRRNAPEAAAGVRTGRRVLTP